MPHLQTLLEQFENEYNIKINLVDYDGLVQVDTDESKIENSYLSTDNLSTDASENFIIEKKKNQTFVTCYIRELDWFLVIQDYGVHRVDLFSIIWSSIGIMIIGVAVMLITFAIIFHQGKKLQGELSKKVEIEQRQMDILIAMSRIYQTSHVINLKEDTVEELRTVNYVMKIVNQSTNATKQMVEVMKYTVSDTYLDAALKFTDLKTLADRMKHSEIIMDDFLGKFNGWFRAQFIVNSLDSDGNIETVIFTTQIIDFEKKYEDRLVEISITDELTGVYNRRAYDKKIKELEQNIPENLEIVAIDLNGLKLVNDTLGHEAGDELIQGAANCIQSVIDTFGQVYRTGGDEFIAVVELEQNQNHVLLAELKEKMQKWHGTYELTLTASCGIASHKEFPELTISKLASVADKRMYEDKCKYYRQSGNNRRKKYDEIKLNQE